MMHYIKKIILLGLSLSMVVQFLIGSEDGLGGFNIRSGEEPEVRMQLSVAPLAPSVVDQVPQSGNQTVVIPANIDFIINLSVIEWTDIDAQYHLGLVHRDSEDIFQNFELAVEYFRMAAEQGHRESQFSLGEMYYNGQGVPQN